MPGGVGSGSSDLTNNQAGYGWAVRLLPFMEETTTYTNIVNASKKFAYPAFAITGGPNAKGANSPSGAGVRYVHFGTGGGQVWRRFSTIDLDAFRCPSFAGDAITTLTNYTPYSDASSGVPAGTQGTPWGVVTTNYKAMAATHFGCLQNPAVFTMANANNYKAPNGAIILPRIAPRKALRFAP